MSNLQFKIVFPPPQTPMSEENLKCHINKYLEKFRECITPCFIVIKNTEILRLSKAEGKAPCFTEIEVCVIAEYIGTDSKLAAYRILQNEWINISRDWSKRSVEQPNMPLLMLFDSKAFNCKSCPAHKHISACDVSFGVLPFSYEFVNYLSLLANYFGLQIDFLHDERKIEICFFDFGRYISNFVLSFSYRNIRKIIVNYNENSTMDLYLDLLHPPLLYKICKRRSPSLRYYEIRKQLAEYCGLTVQIIGKATVLKITLPNEELVFEVISRLRFRCWGLPVYYCHITDKDSRNNVQGISTSMPKIHILNFSCQYLLTAIFLRNLSVLLQCLLDSERLSFMTTVSDCVTNCKTYCSPECNNKCIEKALIEITFALDSGNWVFFPQALISLCRYYNTNPDINSCNHFIIPENSRLIRRVTITPSRLLFWPPEIMFENRVLRKYDPEFALRVNFRNDDMSRLNWNARYAEAKIFDFAIKDPMTKGITIGDRHYKFLGWSNSQIRDHGVWCYARNNSGLEVYDIRRWMGDFSNIKCVPRYMARMGQAFSQTEDSVFVPLEPKCVRFEQDIEGGWDCVSSKPYCFSDGIGKISSCLAKKVQDTLGHDKHCSAFQIRYGGCKGMLTIDPTLKDTEIVFRASMKKFESPENTRLEIAKTSAPVPLQLNRPFITILNHMGVNPRIFLQLQEEYLRTLTDILLNEQKAAKYLTCQTPFHFIKFEALSKSGIELTTEPFFRMLLLSLHKYNIDKIKKRANIPIDPNFGRNMLAVLDETGTLEYGQVFVQYTKDILLGETTFDTEILKGTVLVTKNPCVHPGDVRKFTAVDVPALHHIIDCIVFPQKGRRPHMNEMSGSDMDGDECVVLWKKELIFWKSNATPADYPSCVSVTKENITEEDMIGFLIEYIKNDQLGVIATAHLALADRLDIFDSKCMSVAAKFSVMVDYAKHGTKEYLDDDEKPKQYPDFMEKPYKLTYKSRKALGKMFRICKDFEGISLLENIKAPVIKVDPDLVHPGWEKYEDDAIKSRDKYNRLLCCILQTYGVQHEAEAFSGAFSRLHCRFQERKDKAEIEKIVLASITALCKNMLKEFHTDITGDADESLECLRQKASAWYVVTYREQDAAYISFPWLVSNYLVNMKLRKFSALQRNIHTPIISKIECMMRENAHLVPVLSTDAVKELGKWNWFCDRSTVELALRVMMQWAYETYIIQEEGYSNRGFLYRDKFAQLFLHIAEKENYVSNSYNSENQFADNKSEGKSAAALCIAFLHFCVTLRFYNENKVMQFLPFFVYKYKELSHYAMFTYHRIAVTGTFSVLQFDTKLNQDLIDMKTEYVESSWFGGTPVSPEYLQNVEKGLVKISGAYEVSLREISNINKVLISAVGTEKSLSIVKFYARKKIEIEAMCEISAS